MPRYAHACDATAVRGDRNDVCRRKRQTNMPRSTPILVYSRARDYGNTGAGIRQVPPDDCPHRPRPHPAPTGRTSPGDRKVRSAFGLDEQNNEGKKITREDVPGSGREL